MFESGIRNLSSEPRVLELRTWSLGPGTQGSNIEVLTNPEFELKVELNSELLELNLELNFKGERV